jgi:hypothetical protein
VERNVSEYIAFVKQHVAEAGLADANSVLKHGLEHRLQFTGRTRNDAQHFGSGGLLLQGLAKFVKQTTILDGDDGLSGETGKQRDLLVGERTDFLPVAGDHPNNIILFKHRNGDDRPNLAELAQPERWSRG